METTTLLQDTAQYASRLLGEQLPSGYSFHNLERTQQIVKATETIGEYEKLSEEEMEITLMAAWLQDTGYKDTFEGHKAKSKAIASAFLEERKVPQDKRDKVLACIMATARVSEPQSKAEKVLLDAIHKVEIEVDRKNLPALNEELLAVHGQEQSELESLEQQINTMLELDFYTDYGKEVLLPARNEHKIKLEKKLKKLQKSRRCTGEYQPGHHRSTAQGFEEEAAKSRGAARARHRNHVQADLQKPPRPERHGRQQSQYHDLDQFDHHVLCDGEPFVQTGQ